MKKLLQLLVLSWLVLAATACTTAASYFQATKPIQSTPDQDVGKMVDLSKQAAQRAGEKTSGAILHQVDTDTKTFTFRFTDKEATKEISVFIPDAGIPPEQWTIDVNARTPLVGNTTPELNLGKLKVGYNRVAQAMFAHWQGCSIRALTLYSENERLTWTAFCNTPRGVVTGDMDGESGVFTPSDAPPAPVPVTATSLP